jgi:hypothetical protein
MNTQHAQNMQSMPEFQKMNGLKFSKAKLYVTLNPYMCVKSNFTEQA